MLLVTESTRARRVAIQRARRRLDELGLLTTAYGFGGGASKVHVELTPLGAEVVKRYRRELQEGLRIRWPREKED